ncbi:MAG TPA: nucleotidyltransferase domain-containing protein [Stellaceae bacterium]|nr:nucleotidyltransferase domain-containing protein [Stellaceae bacterium]
MSGTIDIKPEHRRIVIDILRDHLPPDMRVWVFGSRVSGRVRRYSDLDLALDVGRRLTMDETAALGEAFDECDLPYRVDIIDWHAVDDNFRRIVAADRVPLIDP